MHAPIAHLSGVKNLATRLFATWCLASVASAQISPFDGIRWIEDKPEVKVEATWYELVSIEGQARDEILEFCRETYGAKANKRFVEDLVDVLVGMGGEAIDEADLVLIDLGTGGRVELEDVTMTRAKRQALRGEYPEPAPRPLKITPAALLADLDELMGLLESTSSYARLHGDGATEALRALKAEIEAHPKGKELDLLGIRLELVRALGLLGDRHSRIRFPRGWPDVDRAYLPFALAPLGDQVLLVTPSSKNRGQYGPSVGDQPIVTQVAGRSFDEWVDILSTRHKHAPIEARRRHAMGELTNIAGALQVAGAQRSEPMEGRPTKVAAQVQLGKGTQELSLDLVQRGPRWRAMEDRPLPDNAPPAAIESLFAELEGGVGYVRIPSMWSPSDQPLFFKRLEEKLEAFRAGKALVLDIRHNGGGTRDILMTLAPYIVHPDSSPWVGNVAHVRMTNPPQAGTIIDGMDGRYLFQRGDKRLSKADRAAIARFRKAFKPKWKFDTSRFSEPHFLILRSPGTPPGASETAAPRHLGVPVYVLMNERCFSAASVFAAALKGVKGVTLVGVRTDGSSGRSARFRLGGTGMELKLSTMISFQRDGLTLDGNGTAPDVEIAPDLDQVLGKRDTQLERLLDLIHR